MATPSHAPEALTVYEPTVTGLPPLRPYVRGVWERRSLIGEMARTSLKAKHYNSVLGQIWILLDPLLLAAVYLMLRTVIRPIGSASERNFLIAHLIVGIFFFTFTRQSLQTGANSIVGNKTLVLNASFPRAVLPVQAVVQAFLNFLPTLVVYFGIHAFLGRPFAERALVFLPLLILLLTIFNLGCALFFAPLTVFFRDTGSFLSYITRIWFFTTPILYTVAEIPEGIRSILIWNPLFPFFAMLEQIWVGEAPSAGYMLAAAAWAVASFLIGSVVFLLRERDFAVRL